MMIAWDSGGDLVRPIPESWDDVRSDLRLEICQERAVMVSAMLLPLVGPSNDRRRVPSDTRLYFLLH